MLSLEEAAFAVVAATYSLWSSQLLVCLLPSILFYVLIRMCLGENLGLCGLLTSLAHLVVLYVPLHYMLNNEYYFF